MDDQQQQQQQPISNSPIYQESNEKNAKWLWILIVLIVFGALGLAFVKKIGPFSRFTANTEQEETSPSPFTFSSPSPTSEATTGAAIDKTSAKIRVLNGSGKAGLASVVKNLLESKGYKVTAIGNADNYEFSQTVLRFKSSFKNFEDQLTTDLSGNYSVTDGDLLEATDSADIEIIVGTK